MVETHDKDDIKKAVQSEAKIIGINNRDLTTFKVDMETTALLRPLIPEDKIVVSESGIKTRSDMQKLQKLGVTAALVGETLMASPGYRIYNQATIMTLVKICGIMEIEYVWRPH